MQAPEASSNDYGGLKSMRKHTLRAYFKTFITPRIFLIACVSMGVSVALTAALLQRVALSSSPMWSAIGAVIALALTGTLFPALRRIVDEFIVCDATLRHLVLALMVSGAVSVALLVSGSPPTTLTWRASDGPQMDEIAPVFFGTSWDSIERRVIELHATGDPTKPSPYGAWRAVAELSDVNPGSTLELWVTQPSWAVIDPATNAPPPNSDGVDVIVRVEQGEMALSEQRISLDPPFAHEQRSWRRVVVDLPPGAERLAVEVAMRQTLDNDRVWITEAVIRPFWDVGFGPVLPLLLVPLALSMLVFLRRAPLTVQYAQHIASFFAGRSWLLIGIGCSWLGYMVVWQRGFFLDDWSIGLHARDQQTLEWLPITFTREAIPTFPARILTFVFIPRLIALMWTNEFFVRLLIASCVGVNAFLLGWLVYRILHARLPAVVAGWLFLMPIYTDVTLWAGAAAYVFLSGFTLLMLHAIWSSFVVDGQPYIWLFAACLALLVSLAWAEATVGTISLIPIMGVLCRVRRSSTNWRRIGYRTMLSTIMTIIVVLTYYFLVISTSPLVPGRGGILSDAAMILQRSEMWLKALYWWTLDPSWGGRFTVASYIVGSSHILTQQTGTILTISIIIVLALTVVNWKNDQVRFDSVASVLLMMVLGIVWFVTTLYVPYIFVSGKMFEIRFLYFPLAGLSIVAGTLVALATLIIRHRSMQQALLAAFGVLLVVLSVCTLGHARSYAVRYETDVRAFKDLGNLAPFEAIPEGAQFIPVNLDVSLPGNENLLTGAIISAFEASWSAYAGLNPMYPGKNIEYIPSSRWVLATFSENPPVNPSPFCKQTSNISPVKPSTFFVQGCPVDPARAIVFTSHRSKMTLVRTLVLRRSDGTTRIVVLPIASVLADRGAATIEELVVPVDN